MNLNRCGSPPSVGNAHNNTNNNNKMDTSNIESGHRLLAEIIVAASKAAASPSERMLFLEELRNKLEFAAAHYESGLAEEEPRRALLTFHGSSSHTDRVAVDFDHHKMSEPQHDALLLALNSPPISVMLSDIVGAANRPS